MKDPWSSEWKIHKVGPHIPKGIKLTALGNPIFEKVNYEAVNLKKS